MNQTRSRIERYLIVTLFIFILSSCGTSKIKVDSIFHNGHIITMNDSMPEATVLVVDKGKIVAVGGEDLLEKYNCESKSMIDLKGEYVYPGLIDAHCHFYGYAKTRLTCDLVGTKSWEEVLEKVSEFSKKEGSHWVTGRGWDQNDWSNNNGAYPDNSKLNELFPDRPVILKRVDGHAAICNAKALELSGITKETKVEGGEVIIKDGQLSGVLVDNAVDIVEKVRESPIKEELVKSLVATENECYSYGLTTLADAGLELSEARYLDSLHAEGVLSIYLYMMLNPTKEGMDYAVKSGVMEDDNGKICSFKLYADGALGSRGARLKRDYCDRPQHSGMMMHDFNYYDSFARMTLALTEYQVNTHCIGDSANAMILNILGKILKPGNDLRWRIEHAQIIDLNDIEKFSRFGIVPSVQPTHATSDAPWVEDRICEDRMTGAYAYKQLLNQNNYIALGTDFPVEYINPFYTFYSAVFREKPHDSSQSAFLIGESLSRMDALRGMTVWAAKACRLEHRKGMLKPGMDADFAIMNNDLLKCKKEEVLQTKVKSTYRNGRKVY